MSLHPAQVSIRELGKEGRDGFEWMYSNHKTRTNVINVYFAL